MKIPAFLAVYIVWGSTYLAIRYAIDSIPPWSLSSMRFFVASFLMIAIAFLRKEEKLSSHELKIAAISGIMLVFANALICVIEKWIPSSVVAVVVGLMPIWLMLLGWSFFREARPTLGKITGALIGLAGVALIANSGTPAESTDAVAPYAFLMLLSSSWIWAIGTLVQRKAKQVNSTFRFSAVQMLSGAVFTMLISFIFERPWNHHWETVSLQSWSALAYLIVFGSVVGFTAYAWLSRKVPPYLLSTYALVNPIIAVYLGWLFLSEPLTATLFYATGLVLVGLEFLMAPQLRVAFQRSKT